ncbi:MAG TPA: F0F1 ATP synthase subunit A [Candidatus Angelobacter sp.]|nr:F0F1 ATP synthase subunit A [Candidatus Angelobacter sp.]
MPEQLWFTELLNRLFGPMAASLLSHIGIKVANPAAPINNIVAMELLVTVLLIAFFFLVRMRLSPDNPGALQHIAEMAEEFISGQAHEIIGHDYRPHVAYLMTVGFFILFCNLLGLVPGFESPTASPAVPLGCAITTFVYYNFYGIRRHGAHYIKQFMGPVLGLSPVMFAIEVISHLARILSLTVRLYANMFAGDMVTIAFFSLVPILVPVAFLGLHLFVSLVQTFIFVVLTMVYVGLAVSEEH